MALVVAVVSLLPLVVVAKKCMQRARPAFPAQSADKARAKERLEQLRRRASCIQTSIDELESEIEQETNKMSTSALKNVCNDSNTQLIVSLGVPGNASSTLLNRLGCDSVSGLPF